MPLLSNIGKILESLMYSKLYSFIEKKKNSLQFGFRQKHSTTHALIHLTEKIKNQINEGNHASGIFAQVQKAFDTVGHIVLLHQNIMVSEVLQINGYLSNRKQFVSLNSYKSNLVDAKCGVPSGSILRPLFVFYLHK